ncbi:hypothetical protein J7444_08020 [Labrenzia sp. R4_1]|uniref:hypothetical protein n=1 Tax=Labrenzia sp. R4_1 TaxID=2821106 RepID=UPI001ADA75D1|nr:hypothetical protein [Labrenzia sp. R4_1]MBO9424663.1 hypothetical protein [Labrenzia sp. R4_1]
MMTFRQNLRLFLWARAQHRLRQEGWPATFSAAAELIAGATKVDLQKVRATLGGGFSTHETQSRMARWCGLKFVPKHGAPVLVADPTDAFERGPGGGIAPFEPEELRRRFKERDCPHERA